MILAIDPGSQKMGVAILDITGNLIEKKIIHNSFFEEYWKNILEKMDIHTIVSGDGTHHKDIIQRIESIIKKYEKSIPVVLVNEKYTTEMAKQWYWKENNPYGLNRFLPQGLRTIPVPVDDYVAWILGRIFLGLAKPENVKHKKNR